MNDIATEQLMHDVLDGEATAEEKARLEQHLAADPALRERFTRLQSMFETLNRMPMADAPAGMHTELMRAIEEEEAGRTRTPGWMVALADAFRARPVPAFAMGAVTIAALALVLWSGAGRKDSRLAGGDSPVAGTMAPPSAPQGATLEAGDARIRVDFDRQSGALMATFAGHAPSGATLGIDTDMAGAPTLQGEGAELLPAGSEPGRIGVRLAGAVNATLQFDAPQGKAHEWTVSLATADGAVQRKLSMGSGRKDP